MSVRTKLLLAALIGGLAFGLRVLPGPRTIDDAFITFRYARNLLAGAGPVFNPGSPVLGTTTPLYMGILAAAALPFGGAAADFPLLALLLNALADALACLLLIRSGYSLRAPAAGWAAALLWAAAPMSVTFAVGGLETSVYVLLLVAILYFRLEGKYIALGTACALAFLARPDALILIALVGAELAWRLLRPSAFRGGWKNYLRFALPAAAIAGAWLLFARLYYSTLLPHSMLAKAVAYRLDPGSGLIRLIQHYGTPFFEHLTFGSGVVAVAFPLYLFLSLIAVVAARRLRPEGGAAAVLLYPWAYFAVFAAANPLIFRWYLAPPLPFLFLSIFLGLAALLGLAGPAENRPGIGRRALLAGFAAAALLLSARDWVLHPDHGPDRPAPEMAFIKLELLYRQAAEDLRPRLQPGAVVAAGDVGVLGYYLDVPILDTVGLNSPESVAYYPLPAALYVIVYAIPPDLILAERPAVVVFLEVYGRNGLLQDPRFLAAYGRCGEYPTDLYGSRSMLAYCRKDAQ
jgi:arabinofuranosyltransferase